MINESLKIIYEVAFINYVVDINDVSLFYPIDFKKLMNNTVLQYKLNTKCKTDLHPHTIIQHIKELYEYCSVNGQKNYALLILLLIIYHQ